MIMIMGYFIFSCLVDKTTKAFKFTSTKAEKIAKNALCTERNEIRNSKVFKNRLSEILKTIKERASKNETDLRVTHIEGCKTDKQIRKDLEERGFYIIRVYENGMTIRW